MLAAGLLGMDEALNPRWLKRRTVGGDSDLPANRACPSEFREAMRWHH